MKIRPVVAEFLHSDGRTDRHAKLIVEILRKRLKMTTESVTKFSMGCTSEVLGFDSVGTCMCGPG
jgi:hypothetical protein